MEKEDEQYLEALNKGVRNTRTNLAIFVAPLLLMLAQLRTIIALDVGWLSLLATIALLAFSVGTVVSFLLLALFQSFEVKEILDLAKREKGRGVAYLNYYKSLHPNLTEEWLIGFANRIAGLSLVCMLLGYLSLATLLIAVIWSTPGE